MTQPRLLMLDEPSQGIMPRLVDDIFAAVTRIRALGVTNLLTGSAAEIAANDEVRRAYLGI
jgi:branched-chain amino acid transport system ATP-binding protein